ncbi:hypothetical protein GCM10027048_18720 [Hymenobacter coalescens]
MAYFPQSEEEFRDQFGGGRYAADNRRFPPDPQSRRPSQPNDFRDYQDRPDLRRQDFRAADRSGHERDQNYGRGEQNRPASDLNHRRRAGAAGYGYGDVAREYGQGRAGFSGDHDRGYDQNGLRGGLGNSGGRDDFADRRFDQDRNPFRGGYGGGDYDHGRRDEPLLGRIGMNSRNPAEPRGEAGRRYSDQWNDDQRPDDRRSYGRGWHDMDDHHDRGRRR